MTYMPNFILALSGCHAASGDFRNSPSTLTAEKMVILHFKFFMA